MVIPARGVPFCALPHFGQGLHFVHFLIFVEQKGLSFCFQAVIPFGKNSNKAFEVIPPAFVTISNKRKVVPKAIFPICQVI